MATSLVVSSCAAAEVFDGAGAVSGFIGTAGAEGGVPFPAGGKLVVQVGDVWAACAVLERPAAPAPGADADGAGADAGGASAALGVALGVAEGTGPGTDAEGTSGGRLREASNGTVAARAASE
jgi:hypothetical protein